MGGWRRALKLARTAGFFLMPVSVRGAVRIRDGVLEIGPDACVDLIAAISCRKILEAAGDASEEDVQAMVEFYGYVYVSAPWATLASTTLRVFRAC